MACGALLGVRGLKPQKQDLRLIGTALGQEDKQKDHQSPFTTVFKCPPWEWGESTRAGESNENHTREHQWLVRGTVRIVEAPPSELPFQMRIAARLELFKPVYWPLPDPLNTTDESKCLRMLFPRRFICHRSGANSDSPEFSLRGFGTATCLGAALWTSMSCSLGDFDQD